MKCVIVAYVLDKYWQQMYPTKPIMIHLCTYTYILDRRQVKLIVKPNKQRCMQTSNRPVWLICQLWQNIKLVCSLVSIKFVVFLAWINSIYYKSIGRKKEQKCMEKSCNMRVLLQSIKNNYCKLLNIIQEIKKVLFKCINSFSKFL